eukprot:EG_transcript_11799
MQSFLSLFSFSKVLDDGKHMQLAYLSKQNQRRLLKIPQKCLGDPFSTQNEVEVDGTGRHLPGVPHLRQEPGLLRGERRPVQGQSVRRSPRAGPRSLGEDDDDVTVSWPQP